MSDLYEFTSIIQYFDFKCDEDYRGRLFAYVYLEDIKFEKYNFEGAVFYNCFFGKNKDRPNALVLNDPKENFNAILNMWRSYTTRPVTNKLGNRQKQKFLNYYFSDIDFAATTSPYLQGLVVNGMEQERWGNYLSHINLKKAYLRDSKFSRFRWEYGSFMGADLRYSTFENMEINTTDFQYSNLKGVKFLETEFSECVFEHTYVKDAFFEKVVFQNATSFSLSYRLTSYFRQAYQTDPQEIIDAISKIENPTQIENSTFKKCDVVGSRFIGLEMKEGVVFDECNVSGAFFSFSDLSSSKFRECEMTYIGFQMATLQNGLFSKCETENLDFRGADLRGTVFNECDLTGVILFDADIRGVDFSTSEIHSRKLKGAKYNKDTKFPSWLENMLKKDNDFELIFVED